MILNILILLFCIIDVLSINENKNTKIIIIGAGAAGIAAATKLLNNGFKKITILEAENRIGGRIYSVNFGEKISILIFLIFKCFNF